jgi:hypothetical protein
MVVVPEREWHTVDTVTMAARPSDTRHTAETLSTSSPSRLMNFTAILPAGGRAIP